MDSTKRRMPIYRNLNKLYRGMTPRYFAYITQPWAIRALFQSRLRLKKAARTLAVHLDGLLNYFVYRITNALRASTPASRQSRPPHAASAASKTTAQESSSSAANSIWLPIPRPHALLAACLPTRKPEGPGFGALLVEKGARPGYQIYRRRRRRRASGQSARPVNKPQAAGSGTAEKPVTT